MRHDVMMLKNLPKSVNPKLKRFKSFDCNCGIVVFVVCDVVSCKRCRPTAMPIGIAAPAVYVANISHENKNRITISNEQQKKKVVTCNIFFLNSILSHYM
jgi:hypothetical protein